jgi:predicted 2-oxoglutarate/Fe(II)-dependent dioxygenase YbiX
MGEGDQLGWHFDMTDFVVSLALQPSLAGGKFENAQRLRTVTDENYDGVQSVLLGNAHDCIRVEPMHAGTLMIFNGRTSLHKVTPVEGNTLRIVALLAYDTKSGTDSSDELKLSRYGRLPQ